MSWFWWVVVGIGAWIVLTFDLTRLSPFRLRRAYSEFFARQDPLRRELAHASHGGGMLALAAFAWACVWATHRGDVMSFLHEGEWQIPAAIVWAGMIVVGFLMLRTGWKASQTALDVYGERIVMRCVAKLGFAALVWWAFFVNGLVEAMPVQLAGGIALANYQLPALRLLTRWAVMAVIIWCIVTAAIKLVLVLRGRRVPSLPVDPGDKEHGDADFWKPK